MPRFLKPGAPYSGRPPGVAVKALALSREAAELLSQMAQSPKTQGNLVTALIYAEAARREERKRVRQALAAVTEEAEVTE